MPEPAITLTSGLPPLPLIAASALLLFLPGYATASLLLPPTRYTAVEQLLAAPALTLAALSLLTLWATTLHIPLGPPFALALLLASLASLTWSTLSSNTRRRLRFAARGRWRGPHSAPHRRPTGAAAPTPAFTPDRALTACPARAPAACAGQSGRAAARAKRRAAARALPAAAVVAAGYLGLFALALGPRLWSTREMLPTLGADTYHHTLIAALLVERGGLPASYAPYVAIASFAYHFGFHTLVAWLHWWTGADVGAIVGLSGHLVNAAVALSVAFFVLRVSGDGLVAALAAWLVALLCVFPAYLVNWGRYTQAAGLVLLPVAAALCIDVLRPGRDRAVSRRATLAAAMAASGLLLAHYRMAAMLALLVMVWLVYLIIECSAGVWPRSRRALSSRPPDAKQPAPESDRSPSAPGTMPAATGAPWPGVLWRAAGAITTLGAVALTAVLLTLPWLLRLASGLSLGLGQQPGDYGAAYYDLERLGTAITQPTNLPLLALAALGLALAGLLRRHLAPGTTTPVLLLGAWALAQLWLANPRWWPIPMPLAGRVDLITTIAALCFPLTVAAALPLAEAGRRAARRWAGRGVAAALLLGGGATLVGGWQLQALVTPSNALVAPADLAAAAWLRTHTPPDARVAVSSVIFPWAPDYVVGVDGGYWLPLLAGRATTVLPMLYPGERGADAQAVARMVAVAEALRDAPAAPTTAALLRAQGVGYVYHSGRSPLPAAAGLAGNPALRLVYDQDGVRIWAVAGG